MSGSRSPLVSHSAVVSRSDCPEETPDKKGPESSQKPSPLPSPEKHTTPDNSTLEEIRDHDMSEADDLSTSARRRRLRRRTGKRISYYDSDSSSTVPSVFKSGKKRKDGTVTSPTRHERDKKRAKVEVPRVKKHATYWYPDGNVVVQIEDTQFRLHRSQLVRQSEFFSALFGSYSQRAHVRSIKAYEAGEVDGHPLFILLGVSLTDFETLLAALDDAITYYFQPPSFHDFAAILRASTSLQFGKWRSWAVVFFERMWPDDLEALDEKSLGFPVETIILAEQHDVPRVLKRAFYELLTTIGFAQTELDEGSGGDDENKRDKDKDEDEYEYEYEDNDEDEDEGEDEDEDKGIERESRRADEANPDDEHDDEAVEVAKQSEQPESPVKTQTQRLSSADLLRLVTAREKLTAAWVSGFAYAPNTFVCPQAKPCLAATEQQVHWTSLMYMDKIFENYLYNPLCGIQYLIKHVNWKKAGYCKACIAARTKSWETLRKKLWTRLDRWLDL